MFRIGNLIFSFSGGYQVRNVTGMTTVQVSLLVQKGSQGRLMGLYWDQWEKSTTVGRSLVHDTVLLPCERDRFGSRKRVRTLTSYSHPKRSDSFSVPDSYPFPKRGVSKTRRQVLFLYKNNTRRGTNDCRWVWSEGFICTFWRTGIYYVASVYVGFYRGRVVLC